LNSIFRKHVGGVINSWEIGQGKVFGRINGALNFSLILSTWLIVSGWAIPSYFILLFVIVVALFFLVSGFVYIKLGLYKAEVNNLNKINPFQKEVLERLDKIEVGLVK